MFPTQLQRWARSATGHTTQWHRHIARPASVQRVVGGSNLGRRSYTATTRRSGAAAAVKIDIEYDTPSQPTHSINTPHHELSFVGKTGGQIFHEMMIHHGVKHIFGYPGGAILPVFDGIYNSPHFDFILPKHEQGAGHMAEGYAKASGKPGVVLVTSGPGATNVITPLQNAMSDGTPLIVFCGQVATSVMGSDAFQEADILGISWSCTKWNVMVRDVAELPRRINEAFHIATTGRPGPVLVDLPKDVTASVLGREISLDSTLPVRYTPTGTGTVMSGVRDREVDAVITRIAKLVNGAKQPVIYAGQGVVSSQGGPQLLKALAEKALIPVTTTLNGLGAFDELDEKSLHMLGMHGAAYANKTMQEADLVIALGARFDDRVTLNISKFAPAARAAEARGTGGIVQFDILPKNVNKVVQATEAVVGDVAQSLALLLPHVHQKSKPERRDWFDQIRTWKAKWPLDSYDHTGKDGLIVPQSLIKELSDLTANRKQDTIITTGVGQHQMWTAQHFRWRYPRSIITSGGLGTMGFGLPAAIGAKVARPDALVIDIDGDASFGMTLTELSTAAQFNIGVKVIVLNNEEQGMITQWQNIFYDDRYAHSHQRNPDFMKLAQAMHVGHRKVSRPDQVTDALTWLINTEGPALLEVVTERKIPVLPFVPAGKGLHEFLVWDREGKQAVRGE